MKSDHKTKTAVLKEDTYDVGEARFAAKFQKTTDSIALYVQPEYTDGASVAFDMKAMIATAIEHGRRSTKKPRRRKMPWRRTTRRHSP